MRSLILLLLMVILFSFISKKELVTPKITAPPGTVLLKEGLYMDKEEVSNGAWKEFTKGWLLQKEDDTATYQKMLPDSMVWVSRKFDRDKYMDAYFQSNIYEEYPVVGISYEQAVAFCEWRTERVNELLQKTPGSPFKKVEYRLPTESEWQLGAAGHLDSLKFPYGFEQVRKRVKSDTIKLLNCIFKDIDPADLTEGNIMPVYTSIPNKYGIFNIIGNAAEMVSEKGLAKGGHYGLPLEYCTVLEKMSYKGPNRFLGFRCVCTVDNNFSSKQQKEAFKKEKPTKEEIKKEKTKKKTPGFQEEQ